jgi:hypothetical protein
MAEQPATIPEQPSLRRGLRASHVVWIVLAAILLTAAATYWVVRTFVYAKDFTPVSLADDERRELDAKLRVLGFEPAAAAPAPGESDEQWLRPERYDERGARREVAFNERELNAIVANDPSLARRLSIDLSDDLVSARLLVPVDPDFPLLGGKTLRVAAGIETAFRDARPVVVLRGVSVMGIPIPNAWLGGLKNIDLIREYGDQDGFWQRFAAGVEDIRVEEGQLRVRLSE